MRHGQAVQVEYRDLADPQVQAGLPDLFARAEAERLPYPLIVINGQLTMAGSAQYYDVLPLLEQVLNQGFVGGN